MIMVPWAVNLQRRKFQNFCHYLLPEMENLLRKKIRKNIYTCCSFYKKLSCTRQHTTEICYDWIRSKDANNNGTSIKESLSSLTVDADENDLFCPVITLAWANVRDNSSVLDLIFYQWLFFLFGCWWSSTSCLGTKRNRSRLYLLKRFLYLCTFSSLS